MLPDESEDDYMEVTNKEKASMEAKDSGFIEPDPAFVELWNLSCRGCADRMYGDNTHNLWQWGRYNEETGFFELNGITDIAEEEARRIVAAGRFNPNISHNLQGLKARTNLPMIAWGGTSHAGSCLENQYTSLLDASDIEVLNAVPPRQCFSPYSSSKRGYIVRASRLRKIIGRIDMRQTGACTLYRCIETPKLQEAEFILQKNVATDISGYPMLNAWSYMKLVEYTQTGTDTTVKTTEEIYGKMTDGENPEWEAVWEAGLAKGITFVV